MQNKIQKIHYRNAFTIIFGILFFFLSAFSLFAGENSNTTRNPAADFDGDGKSDISVFRPSNGFWYVMKSSGGFSAMQWGLGTDDLIPGDYDGDGRTDLAVFRNFSDSTWYILKSSDNSFYSKRWGATNMEQQLLLRDTPAPADYDGDGKIDLAVYRLTDYLSEPGRYVILQSSTNSPTNMQWGGLDDRRATADYDGDGKADYAVYRSGTWFILQSSNGLVRTERFGLPSDRLVPADYDGDGKADIAVFRSSNGYWYYIKSSNGAFNGSFTSIQFGASEDKPVPADYDGDGKTDIAVFRPSTGIWYLLQSTNGFAARQFGFGDDVPIPNVFVR